MEPRIVNSSAYALGYRRAEGGYFPYSHDPSIELINLAPLVRRDVDAAKRRLARTLAAIDLTPDVEYVTSFMPLHGCIRDELATGAMIELREYDLLSTLGAMFFQHTSARRIRKQAAWAGAGPWKAWTGLRLRYGYFELQVLETALRAPEELARAGSAARARMDDANWMYSNPHREHFFSAADAEWNLRRLMTNSGFYMARGNGLDRSLEIWVHEYTRALEAAHSLFPLSAACLQYNVVQDFLYRKHRKLTPYVPYLLPESFYESLRGHSVALVTPLHAEIASQFTSRRLFDLYTDIAIPEFDVVTIPAYISTYPNRPHGSWAETFRILCDDIVRVLDKQKVTLFFSSCGCYGLPVSLFVYERYGIPTAYWGNYIHTLFGVRQQCSEDFMPGRRKLENWVASHLGEVPNMSLIDGGRYV